MSTRDTSIASVRNPVKRKDRFLPMRADPVRPPDTHARDRTVSSARVVPTHAPTWAPARCWSETMLEADAEASAEAAPCIRDIRHPASPPSSPLARGSAGSSSTATTATCTPASVSFRLPLATTAATSRSSPRVARPSARAAKLHPERWSRSPHPWERPTCAHVGVARSIILPAGELDRRVRRPTPAGGRLRSFSGISRASARPRGSVRRSSSSDWKAIRVWTRWSISSSASPPSRPSRSASSCFTSRNPVDMARDYFPIVIAGPVFVVVAMLI